MHLGDEEKTDQRSVPHLQIPGRRSGERFAKHREREEQERGVDDQTSRHGYEVAARQDRVTQQSNRHRDKECPHHVEAADLPDDKNSSDDDRRKHGDVAHPPVRRLSQEERRNHDRYRRRVEDVPPPPGEQVLGGRRQHCRPREEAKVCERVGRRDDERENECGYVYRIGAVGSFEEAREDLVAYERDRQQEDR